MAAQAKKKAPKSRRILTKREKSTRRVQRVHKAIQRKRQQRQHKKKKASAIRRKLAAVEDNQIIEMAPPQLNEEGGSIATQMNLMNILGLTSPQGNMDWQSMLQKKLKEADQKSLDNPQVKRVYSQIGKIFTRYRSGKVPKAFKIIPNLQSWKEVVEMTRPDQWTSQAMVQAVNIFASNLDPVRAEQFYRLWLVPAVRRDLASSKKLNVHLYEALKKALYKTNAWFKGVLFQFCAQNTLLRQMKVIQSLISKMSIPVISASVAMLKLMTLPPSTAIFHYLSAFLSKHYNMPKRVLNQLCTYLLQFIHYQGQLLVVWQSLLLNLAKQYGQCLDQMQKEDLKGLAKIKMHKLITPEIVKYLG